MATITALATAAASSITASGVGTALSIGSTLLGGAAQYGQSKYQSQVAKNNAEIARENALREGDKQQQDILAAGQNARNFVGEQLAQQGASGADVNSASSILTRRQTQRVSNEEFLDIANAGSNNINAYLQQEADFKSEANAASSSGKFALFGSLFKAGTMINTAGPLTASPSKYIAKPTFRYQRPV